LNSSIQLRPDQVNPVRNSGGTLNPAGIILKSNPAAEQGGIISNGVNMKINLVDAVSVFLRVDLSSPTIEAFTPSLNEG
jgi:hypothetical protein